jgi:hypothetical protein
MAKKPAADLSIGKFDILATYTFAQARLDGMQEDEAKQRGMVAAIMGAQARLGSRHENKDEFEAEKEAAEKKKKTSITAASFDRQVKHKMGDFFEKVFLPTMQKFVEADLSYDDVKHLLKIPSTWGAKIEGEQFRDRASRYIDQSRDMNPARGKKKGQSVAAPYRTGGLPWAVARRCANALPQERLDNGHGADSIHAVPTAARYCRSMTTPRAPALRPPGRRRAMSSR